MLVLIFNYIYIAEKHTFKKLTCLILKNQSIKNLTRNGPFSFICYQNEVISFEWTLVFDNGFTVHFEFSLISRFGYHLVHSFCMIFIILIFFLKGYTTSSKNDTTFIKAYV